MDTCNDFNKRILVAVDDSPYADRTVDYVGFMFGGDPAVRILLLHGLSRQEQFLFGSVSNVLLNNSRGCTIWVVA